MIGASHEAAGAQFKLCYSRRCAAAYLCSQEMLLEAHEHAWDAGGGRIGHLATANRGEPDRPVQAPRGIPGFCRDGEPLIVRSEFCNRRGLEKGRVEQNCAMSAIAMAGGTGVPDAGCTQYWLGSRCVALWHETAHPDEPDRTIGELWQEEKAQLAALPPAFDGYVEAVKRVSPTCLIHFERNRYSVPASYANRPVSVRVYAERLVIVAEGQVIAEHARLIVRSHDAPGRTVYDWRHYLAVLQRNPERFATGHPLARCPKASSGCRHLASSASGGPGDGRDLAGAAPRTSKRC